MESCFHRPAIRQFAELSPEVNFGRAQLLQYQSSWDNPYGDDPGVRFSIEGPEPLGKGTDFNTIWPTSHSHNALQEHSGSKRFSKTIPSISLLLGYLLYQRHLCGLSSQ